MKTSILIILVAASTAALSIAAAPADSSEVDDLIKQGAVFDERFDAKDALKYYDAAEKLDPKNVDLIVRMARQYRYLLADASSKTEKLRLGHIALGYSERAALLAPDNPEAQLSPAISYGKMMPYLPQKEQVEATSRIKTAVDRTLRLDPGNDTAWDILGRWNRVLADISGLKRMLAGAIYGSLPKGSNETAEACLLKAVALNPNRVMHRIELGRVYAQMGRKEDARRCINKGLTLPNTEKDDPETKAKGREALQKLK